jgi:hypothetical protein
VVKHAHFLRPIRYKLRTIYQSLTSEFTRIQRFVIVEWEKPRPTCCICFPSQLTQIFCAPLYESHRLSAKDLREKLSGVEHLTRSDRSTRIIDPTVGRDRLSRLRSIVRKDWLTGLSLLVVYLLKKLASSTSDFPSLEALHRLVGPISCGIFPL